jgi:hypothetical protein
MTYIRAPTGWIWAYIRTPIKEIWLTLWHQLKGHGLYWAPTEGICMAYIGVPME